MTKIGPLQLPGARRDLSHRLRRVLICVVAVASFHSLQVWSAKAPVAPVVSTGQAAPSKPVLAAGPQFANFGKETPSADARHVADWVADARDNVGMEFLIVDKNAAKLYVFDANALLKGASTVLLGAAKGDDSAPGIGLKPLKAVKPEEKTTPAGRFLAERGRNIAGEDVIWIDYDAAVSMHRVRASNAKERRLERLASATVDDNRISFGCINVPAVFYNTKIKPVFAKRRAVVYVLPEMKNLQAVFRSYDVATKHATPLR